MKTPYIALISAVVFLSSCGNDKKVNTSILDTPSTSVTVKKDTVIKKKYDSRQEEEHDQKIMDDILKKRKMIKIIDSDKLSNEVH